MLGRLLNDSIPLLTLTSWVKAAAKCGFSIEPIFERVGIPADLTQLEKVRVSPLKLLGLLQACVDASRAAARGPGPHPHYPFVLGESFAFEFMPELETYLTTSSTLREAVKATGWAADLINPMMKLTLQEQADEARIVLSFDLPFLPQAVVSPGDSVELRLRTPELPGTSAVTLSVGKRVTRWFVGALAVDATCRTLLVDGNTDDAGIMTSINILLTPATYTFTYSLAGVDSSYTSPAAQADNIVDVSIGSFYVDQITKSWGDPFSVVSSDFTVLTGTTVNIVFANQGGDNYGAVLDSMTLVVPEPGTGLLLSLGLLGLARRKRLHSA